MAEPTQPQGVTLDELKERARVLGLRIAEDQWEQIHLMVSRALQPVRAFDEIELKPLEPSVLFRTMPEGAGAHDRRSASPPRRDA